MTNFVCKCSECINMHQNTSKCMQNELCKGFVHETIKEVVFIAFKGAKIGYLGAENYHTSVFIILKWAKIGDLGAENSTFTSECSKCINMHQNTSKCMQNELCKGFVHEIIKELVFIKLKGAKINEIHLPLYDGTPCICKGLLL